MLHTISKSECKHKSDRQYVMEDTDAGGPWRAIGCNDCGRIIHVEPEEG